MSKTIWWLLALQKAEGRRQKAEGRRQSHGRLPYRLAAYYLLPTAFCLLPSAFCPPAQAQTHTVGQLLNVTGRVDVQRGKQAVMKGTLLFQLEKGDVLTSRAGGAAEVVLFKDGARFGLPAGSSARVGAAGLEAVSGPKPQALAGLSTTFVRRMNAPARQVSPRILGVLVRPVQDPTLGPRQPSPHGAVRMAPVVLHWLGPVEGEALRLVISDGENAVLREELKPTAREFTVPEGKLKPGEFYVWSVTAVHGGDASVKCRALVRVLTPEERTEVERLEKETAVALAAAPDNPAPTLLLAQVYERLGMYDDALAAYEAARKLRPEDTGVKDALKRLSGEE
jgi:tetratricopeptide (TPR) repeat protein